MTDDLIERLRGLLDGGVEAMKSCAETGCVECAERLEAADEIERLKDQVWAAYLAGFCSSTVEFNGDTHGHNRACQQTDWHWDNYEAWGFLDDEDNA